MITIIQGCFQESVIAQKAIICGEIPQLLVLKGGVKNREQIPAESLMVLNVCLFNHRLFILLMIEVQCVKKMDLVSCQS